MKQICLDAGHYSGIAGKRSPDRTYAEHEFNLDMAYRMKTLLERYGVSVTLTRSADVDVTLAQRVSIANRIIGLDLFVSLHSNAAGNNGWYDSARGYVIYTSAAGDTAKRNIAAQALLKRAKEAGILIRGAGLVHNGLYVCKHTNAPAILIEHGFHTSRDDVALLKSSAYRDKLAEANCKGICDFLGVAWNAEDADFKTTVKTRFGLADETVAYLERYEYGGELLRKLATKG